MGSYLSSPVRVKESENGTGPGGLLFGASAMQGWRVSQEDAHVALVDFDEGGMLFAVFDGHGGAEVAKYAAMHLGNHIKSLEKYKEGKYAEALHDGFLSFDALLKEAHVQEVLRAIAKSSDSGDEAEDDVAGSEDEEDLEQMFADAEEPIEDVLARIGNGQMSVKHLDLKRIMMEAAAQCAGEDGEWSSDDDSDADSMDDTVEVEENGMDEDEEEEAQEKKETDVVAAADKIPKVAVKLSHLVEVKNELDEKVSIKREEEIVINGPVNQKAVADILGKAIENGHAATDCKVNGIEDHHSSRVKQEIKHETAEAVSSTTNDESGSSAGSGAGSASSNGGVVAGRSVIIDDDAPGTSSGAGGSGVDSCVADNEEADTDYRPTGDEIDSDDDDEEDWEDDEQEPVIGPPVKQKSGLSRRSLIRPKPRMLRPPGSFQFDDMAQPVLPGYDSGATACLALIKNNVLYVANVGDSRCVVSQNGATVDMSVDHKPEDAIETERINKAGGKVTPDGRVNNGLNLSRALGDHNYKRNESLDLAEQMISAKPDVKTLQLDSSCQFMVIACDGIWNSLSSEAVVEFVKQRLSDAGSDGQLSKICEQMFDGVIATNSSGDGTGMDNMTCIIVKFPQNVKEESKTSNGDNSLPSCISSLRVDSQPKRPAEDDKDSQDQTTSESAAKKPKLNQPVTQLDSETAV